jgi:hypothetical protein
VELEILTGDLVRVAHETVQPARYSLWLRYSASDKKPRADRLSAPLAWFVCALSVASALSGLVFLYMNGNFASVLKDEGVDAVAAVAFPIVGAIIAARRPRNPIGWIFCFTGLSLGIAIFAAEYAVYALVTEPGALPVGVLAAWLGTWTWVPGIVLGPTFLLLLFPHGQLPSRRWLPVAWISTGATVLGVGVLMVLPWDLLNTGVPAGNPLEVEGAQTVEVAVFVVWIGVGMARGDRPGPAGRRVGLGGAGDGAACARLAVVAPAG